MNDRECFCCSCHTEPSGYEHRDPHCRNHGFDGKRPCETHGMPGYKTELTDTPRMPESVEKKRRLDLPLFPEAEEQAWTGDDPPATNPHAEETETSYIFTFEDDVEPFARIEENHEEATATTPYRHFPKMEVTEDGLSASFDLTSMVHDLTRQAMKRVEEGAVAEVVAFLAANGHLDDVIRKAKDEAWQEGLLSAGLDLDYTLQIMGTNPYAEEP